MTVKTLAIVLRKIPYSETSIIAGCLSGEHGKLDFVVRGAKTIGRKQFPELDIFRELSVEFKKTQSSLRNLYSVEMNQNFDRIALVPENFIEGSRIASFILRNSQDMMPVPLLYSALKRALASLCENSETPLRPSILVKLVYLKEHGLLPETDSRHNHRSLPQSDNKQIFIRAVIGTAVNGTPLPKASPEYWENFSLWINRLCQFHNLRD